MVRLGRRRLALSLAAAPLSSAAVGGSAGRLSTVFSCGSHFSSARRCSAPCPAGSDDDCPPGQYCYGGVSCDGGRHAMEEALERQRRLEGREVRRLVREREEGYVGRFVCGVSHEEASESCSAETASDGIGEAVRYCPDGSSDRCPAGTRCHAAVPCPRSTHGEESPPWEEVLSGPPRSSRVTEPILFNSTSASDDDGGVAGPPAAALGAAASSLLSFRYGSN